MIERTKLTPEAWEAADWAIPQRMHPLEPDTWDVANCAGDWKAPTPEQVRGYIAQAVHRHQQKHEARLVELMDRICEKLK